MSAYNYYQNPYQAPYQPYSYQPNYMQPAVQQPMFQQSQQAQQTPTVPAAPSSIIWVNTMMEAQQYPVAPNNAVTLWSTTEPVVYLKQADATGKPTLKVYDLVERTESASAAPTGTDVKTPDYATKDELSAVVGAVQSVNGTLNSFRGEIDAIKGDLYGIAGKKKATKKQTEVDEDE